MHRERLEPGREPRVSHNAPAWRGRGGGRGGSTPASDDGFDRFGKREFERHSGSDKTYGFLSIFYAFGIFSLFFCLLYTLLFLLPSYSVNFALCSEMHLLVHQFICVRDNKRSC